MVNVKTDTDTVVYALVTSVNALLDQYVDGYAKHGWNDGYHRCVSSLIGGDFKNPTFTTLASVSTANVAGTLDGYSTLANELCGVMHTHFQDDSAHLKVDTVNDGYLDGYFLLSGAPSQPEPGFAFLPIGSESLSDLMNALNVLKIAFNDHLTQTGVHFNNDTGNSVSASNATDLPSSGTLVAAIKAALNLHISGPQSGPAGIIRLRLK